MKKEEEEGTGRKRQFVKKEEDTPTMALVRQEWIAFLHRIFVSKISPFAPLRAQTKTGRSIEKDGLFTGLQGMFARLLSNLQMSKSCNKELDALLPHVGNADEFHDPEVSKELVDLGIPLPDAEAIIREMAKEACLAAEACEEASNAGLASGTVEVKKQEPGFLLVIFHPDDSVADKVLEPIRARQRAEQQQNIPLYDPAHRQGVQGLGQYSAVLRLSEPHGKKLSMLYKLTAAKVVDPKDVPADLPESVIPSLLDIANGAAKSDDEKTLKFLRRVFCVIARYETYSGNSSGLQGALPHYVFDSLESELGVHTECFASPLNCHFPRFYSAFPDTDLYFGSQGSFFDQCNVTSGSYEANPPFIISAMDGMMDRLEYLLEQSKEDPLVFFVIIPSWKDADSYVRLTKTKFLRASAELPRKTHEYIDGMQHRASRSTWSANTESTWFILTNDRGLERLGGGTRMQIEAKIQSVFRRKTRATDARDRVFKF